MCSKVLSCPLCSQPNFTSVNSLKISLIKVTNRPLICPICDEILLGLDKLTIHLFSHSIINECEEENQKNSIESLKALKAVRKIKNPRKDEKYDDKCKYPNLDIPKCDICCVTFRSNELRTMHINLVHNKKQNGAQCEDDLKFQCHLCPKAFKMKGSLKVHLRVVHLGFQNRRTNNNLNHKSAIKLEINQEMETIDTTDVKDTSLKSPKIENTSVHESLFIQQNINNDLCDSNRIIESKNSSESIKVWECDVCAKSFTTKYFLKKHKRLHSGEMPYSCSICSKAFTFQQSYHKHLLYHSDEKPHICFTCKRAFKELSTLHNHERIHSGEKPFQCESCDKCFRQRVSYLVHRRIHTGAMPYKCTACEKTFRYKVSQRTHKCNGGTVIRSGDLLQKLLQSSSFIQSSNIEENPKTNSEVDDLMTQSLDDLLKESCTKLGIDNNLFDSEANIFKPVETNENVPSPSENLQNLQNLCLYSPSSSTFNNNNNLETINEDSFKQLLLYSD